MREHFNNILIWSIDSVYITISDWNVTKKLATKVGIIVANASVVTRIEREKEFLK